MEKRQSQIEVEYTSIEALLFERSTEFNRMKSQLREVNRKLAESKLENIKLAHENANLRGEHLINKNNNVNTFWKNVTILWKLIKKKIQQYYVKNELVVNCCDKLRHRTCCNCFFKHAKNNQFDPVLSWSFISIGKVEEINKHYQWVIVTIGVMSHQRWLLLLRIERWFLYACKYNL